MHHAWMLAGAAGRGKSAFAKAAAMELVGIDSDASQDFHPDILLLEREPKDDAKTSDDKPVELRRNITIAQVRALQKRLITRPTAGTKRAVIIDPVDDLEQGACNALLKTLEEPPAGTVFLLVAHQPAKLLPTIRSRCRVLRFSQAAGNGSETTRDANLAQAVEALVAGTTDADHALQLFASAVGSRPTRARLQDTIGLAQASMALRMAVVDREGFDRIDRVYGELRALDAELAIYNYDADLIAVRIGALLTGLGASIGCGHG